MTRFAVLEGFPEVCKMIRQRPSPNHDSRNGRAINMLVLHYTGMISADASLDRLCDANAKVSAHYFVDEDGQTTQLVDESRRAWHAGVARWAGETDINAISIGIELQNPGHEHGYRDFPDVQINALLDLIGNLRERHNIPDTRIVGHSDVAPDRKQDPGERFPWKLLADSGHGIWPETGTAAHPVPDATAALSSVGYSVGAASDDPVTVASLLAFQRRYLPDHLSGKFDQKSVLRLGQLYCLVSEP
jgi:N-acetylmuramoyl-L-alanine amidase